MQETLPTLITDLAYILIVAGITTVLFKKLKQPLVLGYIVAGFLAGPYMPYTPTIGDMEECEQWGQIGVIILMFTLGLEFSFKKIVQMGFPPIICACLIMAGMIGVGNVAGGLFGWNSMDSMFLGGMLAMSSTTIIYKAYDDLGLRHKNFASNVLSVLIIEDILGILLMVVLSTIAATIRFEGTALMESLVGLFSVLLIWFLVGVYLLPILLKMYKRYMNNETLMIVSLALCFLLVLISTHAGYSPAFGAFMMGSILAETVEAEQIEKAVQPVRDLFAAIFFVSVGMMVNPDVLLDFWPVILVLTICIVCGQMIIGTLSYLLTGSSLSDSVHSGFSMVQIGEFAFILAVLGEHLGVTSGKLYPIVVAVSIITTFITPYMIKLSTPVSVILQNNIKYCIGNGFNGNISGRKKLLGRINSIGKKNNTVKAWKSLMQALCYQTVSYLVLSSAFVGFGLATLKPLIGIYCIPIIIIFISPFLRAVVIRKNHSLEVRFLREQSGYHGHFINLTIFIRFILSTAVIYSIMEYACSLPWYMDMVLSVISMSIIIRSRFIKMVSIRIERTFKQNLCRRETTACSYSRMLSGRDMHIARLTVPELSKWAGKKLSALNFGRQNNVHIASIVRGKVRINIPGGENMIFPGDVLEVVGDDISIEKVRQKMYVETTNINEALQAEPLTLKKYTLSSNSFLIGKTLANSGIRQNYRCTVIGFEDEEGNLVPPSSERIIQNMDTIWVVGEYENIRKLMDEV